MSMASVFQRRGRWYLRVKDSTGRWKNVACDARTKTEARALVADLAKKHERQRLGLEPATAGMDTTTFDELLDWWWAEYGCRLRSPTIRSFAEKHLRTTLGPVPLREVGSKLEGTLNAKTEELSPESLNHLRALVHRIFSVAARRGRWRRDQSGNARATVQGAEAGAGLSQDRGSPAPPVGARRLLAAALRHCRLHRVAEG